MMGRRCILRPEDRRDLRIRGRHHKAAVCVYGNRPVGGRYRQVVEDIAVFCFRDRELDKLTGGEAGLSRRGPDAAMFRLDGKSIKICLFGEKGNGDHIVIGHFKSIVLNIHRRSVGRFYHQEARKVKSVIRDCSQGDGLAPRQLLCRFRPCCGGQGPAVRLQNNDVVSRLGFPGLLRLLVFELRKGGDDQHVLRGHPEGLARRDQRAVRTVNG